MHAQRTLRLTIGNADDLPRQLWDGLDGHPYDDNGDRPDGEWLPQEPLTESDPGVQAILDAGYGEMVCATYFYDAKAVIEYVHDTEGDPAAEPTADWLDTADEEEVARIAWDEAQNLAAYATRYGNGQVIIIANADQQE